MLNDRTVHYILTIISFLFSLLILTTAGWADPLAQDSATFARFWELERGAQSARAEELLRTTKDSGLGCTQGMANFVLAWQAFEEDDYAGVMLHLDRGVPQDLADYAEWLRAQALKTAGNTGLARTHWERLSRDSSSVFYAEALKEQARTAEGDELVRLVTRHERSAGDAASKQELALMAARILAGQKRHSEAVERLWQAYHLAPATTAAREIRSTLHGYSKKHGVNARAQTLDELTRELQALERGKHFTLGLQRVADETKRGKAAQAEVLGYFKGRYQSGLGRHRDAVITLQDYLRRFPKGPYQYSARLYLGRSAYLTDQDGIAVPALALAGEHSDDPDVAGQALDLLGLLHLDRGRPGEAVKAYGKWAERCQGQGGEQDCLWKYGRALWEAGQMAEAAAVFARLADINEVSDFNAIGNYWGSRAAAKSGNTAEANERRARLMANFPYSYYGVIAPETPDPERLVRRDLILPTLDELWSAGGAHSRKFALLSAMRLPDLALREWPEARREWPQSDGFVWWKAQHQLWKGNRSAAWLVVLGELGIYLRSEGLRPADFVNVAYPLQYDAKIRSLAARHGVDPYFAFGLICQESHYNAGAVSPAGAIGLMQLMPATARIEAKKLGVPYSKNRLFDPDYNLELGIAHLGRLLREFNGDTILVLAAYNAGPSAAQSWYEEFDMRERDVFIERVPYRETRLFIKRNIEHQAAYRRLYPQAASTGPVRASSQP